MSAVPPEENQHRDFVPELVVRMPSWPRLFFGNLRDLVWPRRLPPLELRSAPAAFWPDVFVRRRLPWAGFAESGACHFFACVLLVLVSRVLALQPQPAPRPTFSHSQVIYYSPSEYPPPLDTREERPPRPAKAAPEFSRQAVVSVPHEADNRSQTIVTPPNIKLMRDVTLPNIVAWEETAKKPRLEIPAPPLSPAAEITRIAPQMNNAVVAPPPDADTSTHHRDQPNLEAAVVAPPPDLRITRAAAAFDAPQPAVVAPPPTVANTSVRALGGLNIGHRAVIAPAPHLLLAEQRAVPGGRSSAVAGMAPRVVPPPPAVSGAESAGGRSGGRMIALNLNPAVGAPPVPAPGNRRGAFAATPEGHRGASGEPGSSAGVGGNGDGRTASGASRKGTNGIPAGLYVGSPPATAKTSPVAGNSAGTVMPSAIASVSPPRVASAPSRAVQPESAAKLSEAERAVFDGRRFYSLTLNMPNLNSGGGSWIVRFAELKPDANAPAGDLSQPTATRKVDPAYPLQLIRENVAGTVILYAVIHADGTVGNVRLLRGVEQRLDQYAAEALMQWRFHPATKNGVAIDVEATFQVPFRPPPRNF